MNALLLWVALSGSALAQEAPPEPTPFAELVGIDGVTPALAPPQDADVEALTIDIAEELRCPVCQGLSVADSQAETAVAMFDRIRELVRLGYSEDQIDAYFIARYGDWVLLAPPATGLGVVLWTLPFLLMLGVFAVVITVTRKRQSEPIAAEGTPVDAYMQRVLDDLEEE